MTSKAVATKQGRLNVPPLPSVNWETVAGKVMKGHDDEGNAWERHIWDGEFRGNTLYFVTLHRGYGCVEGSGNSLFRAWKEAHSQLVVPEVGTRGAA